MLWATGLIARAWVCSIVSLLMFVFVSSHFSAIVTHIVCSDVACRQFSSDYQAIAATLRDKEISTPLRCRPNGT